MRDAIADVGDFVDQRCEFASDVKALILTRLGQQIRQLQVIVQDGGLVLRGQAPTYYAKQIAQQIAMESGGVILSNEIEVPASHP
jgi:osmotically-inducible protein OsmY